MDWFARAGGGLLMAITAIVLFGSSLFGLLPPAMATTATPVYGVAANPHADSIVGASRSSQRVAIGVRHGVPIRFGHGYDPHDNLLRVNARPGGAGVAPQTALGSGTDLVRVADFADDAAAFGHYSKHVKGIEFRPNGGYRLKPGGADLSEIGSFGGYRNAARGFMGPDAPPGVFQGYRGTDLVRVDPKTGFFGVRSQEGVIRTFFRPDGDPVAYFWGQF